MPSVYGLESVEVENPDGEICQYLVRAVPALPQCWRSWTVTKASGESYTVSELPTGFLACTCLAFKHDRHGAGRWQKVDGRRCCKHAAAVALWLKEQPAEVPPDASAESSKIG